MIYTIIVKNADKSESREYPIDIIELRKKGTTYDTLNVDSAGVVTITRKIGFEQGETYILQNPIIENYTDVVVMLYQGVNYIQLKDDANTTMSVTYILKNDFTDTYATRVEMHSSIQQTADEITLEVSANYVGNTEVISKINLSPEQAIINANKISLAGKDIDLTGDNITITSDNFSVTRDGILTAERVNLQGVMSNYASDTGFLAVQIDNTLIKLFDYKNDGSKVGEICSLYNLTTNLAGMALVGIKGKKITIGYKDDTSSSTIHALIEYNPISDDSVPYIKNTASGTLFPNAGGITVNNGLITNWNLSGATGTLYLKDSSGNGNVTITVKNGIIIEWIVS